MWAGPTDPGSPGTARHETDNTGTRTAIPDRIAAPEDAKRTELRAPAVDIELPRAWASSAQ